MENRRMEHRAEKIVTTQEAAHTRISMGDTVYIVEDDASECNAVRR